MSEPTPPSILFVDDDEANRFAFSWVLRRAGFLTREVTNGSDALRALEAEQKPDLVILDVNLPDIDGFEVCRRIKSHPATASIPVLHVSAVFTRTEDKEQGLEVGADAYLTKPVEAREVVATVRSLLRMHKAEEAARTAARQWQATFDAIEDAVALLDRDGRLLRWNRALAGLLGQPGGELAGRPFDELLGQAFGGSAAPLVALLRQAPVWPAQEVAVGERWFRVSAGPVRGEKPEPHGRALVLSDVTQRRRLEEQLLQAQKMEAVGRLAGGVAHDFNNLLTAITGNLTLLLHSVPPEGPQREMLLITEKAAWRAAELTRQLLGFSRQARLALEPTDLNRCVEETMTLLRRTLDRNIEVRTECEPALGKVRADAGQMQQILMNLALNARDAMPEGGTLTVETANVDVTEADAAGRLAARPGRFVRLRVSDTGHGIPPSIQHRIFEPFFTTKEQGQGTGLGLAMVFGIVQQHQGWVELCSPPGQGACFDIYLPRLPS
jgi:PAS domain S-box-containing protein